MSTKFEVFAASAESGLGFHLDGVQAAQEISTNIKTPEQAAHDFLTDQTRLYKDGPFKGFISVLNGRDDQGRFQAANVYANGRMVLTPYMHNNRPILLPASVKQEGSGMRLTVYNQMLQLTHDQKISEDQVIKLAGATQATAPSIGSHSKSVIAAEAGHTITMLGAALDGRIGGSDVHSFVHKTVDHGGNIAAVASSAQSNGTQLLGASISSAVFTKDNVPKSLELLWDPSIEISPTMDARLALPFIQGLGYAALVETGRTDNTKRIQQEMQR